MPTNTDHDNFKKMVADHIISNGGDGKLFVEAYGYWLSVYFTNHSMSGNIEKAFDDLIKDKQFKAQLKRGVQLTIF